MHASGLSVVGWYHSHPSNDALPSISDVSQQLMYQECLDNSKGINSPPCIGFIIGNIFVFIVVVYWFLLLFSNHCIV